MMRQGCHLSHLQGEVWGRKASGSKCLTQKSSVSHTRNTLQKAQDVKNYFDVALICTLQLQVESSCMFRANSKMDDVLEGQGMTSWA